MQELEREEFRSLIALSNALHHIIDTLEYEMMNWFDCWHAVRWQNIIHCWLVERLISSQLLSTQFWASNHLSAGCVVESRLHFIGNVVAFFAGLSKNRVKRLQFWRIRYALLVVRRIFTRCCRTTSVNPRWHCGRYCGRCYTCHELSMTVAPSVSPRQHHGTVCPLTSPTLHHLLFLETDSEQFHFTIPRPIPRLAAAPTSPAVRRICILGLYGNGAIQIRF